MDYIKSLVTPTPKAQSGRKVWSLDLTQVWLPFFTATNATGDTNIPASAIGAPLRLSYDKTGQPRFSQAGRPVIRVAKELADSVKMVRDNFTANLIAYAGKVADEKPDAIASVIQSAKIAGEPIQRYDNAQLSRAMLARQKEAEEAQAEEEAKTGKEAELVTA